MFNLNYPVVIKGALPVEMFQRLVDYMASETWTLTNSDFGNGAPSWGSPNKKALIYYDCGSYLKYKLQKFVRKNVSLVKIHLNLQTAGQLSSFHTDFNMEDVWTLVLFTTPQWDMNNGGEFTLYDPISSEYKSVSYIPNTAIFFPSKWDHKGACPLVPSQFARTSVAISYCASDRKEEFRMKHPDGPFF